MGKYWYTTIGTQWLFSDLKSSKNNLRLFDLVPSESTYGFTKWRCVRFSYKTDFFPWMSDSSFSQGFSAVLREDFEITRVPEWCTWKERTDDLTIPVPFSTHHIKVKRRTRWGPEDLLRKIKVVHIFCLSFFLPRLFVSWDHSSLWWKKLLVVLEPIQTSITDHVKQIILGTGLSLTVTLLRINLYSCHTT